MHILAVGTPPFKSYTIQDERKIFEFFYCVNEIAKFLFVMSTDEHWPHINDIVLYSEHLSSRVKCFYCRFNDFLYGIYPIKREIVAATMERITKK